MRYFWLGLVLEALLSSLALCCTCFNSGTACSSLASTPMVFVARVLEDSGEGWGKGPARVAIIENLHGLEEDQKELLVEVAAGTSCYHRLERDETYVIYAGPIPGRRDRVRLEICSFSFRVADNQALLEALRAAQRGSPPRLIGKLTVRMAEYSNWQSGAGGLVIAASAAHRLKTISDQDGYFVFPNAPAGQYRISLDSNAYVIDDSMRDSNGPTVVGAGGCAMASVYAWPNGRIEGRVSGRSGPLGGIEVQAFLRSERGGYDSQPIRTATSDADGKYTIRPLPPGDYYVGVNGEKYRDRGARPPRFFRNAGTRNAAERIRLEMGASVSGIDLELPDPRVPARLRIEIVREDGSPGAGASASLDDAEGVQRGLIRDPKGGGGIIEAPVWLGETYRVRASLFGTNADFVGESGLLKIEAPVQSVRVVLLPRRR